MIVATISIHSTMLVKIESLPRKFIKLLIFWYYLILISKCALTSHFLNHRYQYP